MSDDDVLLVADYTALEVVILADLSIRLFGDDRLAQAIAPDAPDIHAKNSQYVFGTFLKWVVPASVKSDAGVVKCPHAGKRVDEIPWQEFKEDKKTGYVDPYGGLLRDMIKQVFYGWCYGKRGYGFATLIGPDGKMIGEKRGDELVVGLTKAQPGLGKWDKWVENQVDEHWGIYTLGGRWCDLRALMESGEKWQRGRAIRRALNFPAQGTGADIVGDAMVRISRCKELRKLGFSMCLQVHDEIVMRGPRKNAKRAAELLQMHMEAATANGIKLLVPLRAKVGIGNTYAEAK